MDRGFEDREKNMRTGVPFDNENVMSGTRDEHAQLMGNVQAALWYADKGYRVFPVYSIQNGECSCKNDSCISPGKHPITKNGNKNATTDRTQIAAWWHKYPNANIGVATGKGEQYPGHRS